MGPLVCVAADVCQEFRLTGGTAGIIPHPPPTHSCTLVIMHNYGDGGLKLKILPNNIIMYTIILYVMPWHI